MSPCFLELNLLWNVQYGLLIYSMEHYSFRLGPVHTGEVFQRISVQLHL